MVDTKDAAENDARANASEHHNRTPSSPHRDFLNDVPAFRYILPCGHAVFYWLPIPLGEYGYCQGCRDYFYRTLSVKEIPPRQGKKHHGDKSITRVVDTAVRCNRVANLLMLVEGDELTAARAQEIATEVGVGLCCVQEVWAHLYDVGAIDLDKMADPAKMAEAS
jgi:hypothetical protein